MNSPRNVKLLLSKIMSTNVYGVFFQAVLKQLRQDKIINTGYASYYYVTICLV